MLAGTALLTGFACLLETGFASTGANAEMLRILPAILGGWSVAIVAFGVVSTVSLGIQHREREIALLRVIAAVPGQVRRMVVVETLLVAVPMTLLGVLPGLGLGWFVLQQMLVAGAVAAPVDLEVGRFSLVAGTATPLLASTAGPACVAAAIGLSLVSPVIIPTLGRLAAGSLGPVGRLAGRNLRAQAEQISTAVGALVLLVGIATGTLYMQSTEDSTRSGVAAGDAGAALAPANYLAVTMIVVFAGIAVTNTLAAVTRKRGREFGLLRWTAATRGQVLTMVTIEATVSAGLAIALGTAASTVTTVPDSLVRTGSPIPSGPVWIYLAVVAGTFTLAFLTTVTVTVRALRTRPVDALSAI
jgi:putative ABC transport system permease protein